MKYSNADVIELLESNKFLFQGSQSMSEKEGLSRNGSTYKRRRNEKDPQRGPDSYQTSAVVDASTRSAGHQAGEKVEAAEPQPAEKQPQAGTAQFKLDFSTANCPPRVGSMQTAMRSIENHRSVSPVPEMWVPACNLIREGWKIHRVLITTCSGLCKIPLYPLSASRGDIQWTSKVSIISAAIASEHRELFNCQASEESETRIDSSRLYDDHLLYEAPFGTQQQLLVALNALSLLDVPTSCHFDYLPQCRIQAVPPGAQQASFYECDFVSIQNRFNAMREILRSFSPYFTDLNVIYTSCQYNVRTITLSPIGIHRPGQFSVDLGRTGKMICTDRMHDLAWFTICTSIWTEHIEEHVLGSYSAEIFLTEEDRGRFYWIRHLLLLDQILYWMARNESRHLQPLGSRILADEQAGLPIVAGMKDVPRCFRETRVVGSVGDSATSGEGPPGSSSNRA